jgi:transposase-like protein
MPKRPKRSHDQHFKTRLVLEALKEQKTLAQLSTQFELHANQITDWKKQVVSSIPTLFEGRMQQIYLFWKRSRRKSCTTKGRRKS